VDDYEVKVDANTARPFDWTNNADAAFPYSQRDPRLGYSILTNNTMFKDRPVECFTGEKTDSPAFRATRTGYYLLKYVDPNVDLLLNTRSVHTWILIRLAEIYLNYAEALNECQPGTRILQLMLTWYVREAVLTCLPCRPVYLKVRCAMPIRHERRIELALRTSVSGICADGCWRLPF